MFQFLLGFALGNVVGMYLAQNYDIPDLAKKLEDFKKMWKLRRNLPVTNRKPLMLTRSSPHKFQGYNSPSSYKFQVEFGLWGFPPLPVSQNLAVLELKCNHECAVRPNNIRSFRKPDSELM